MTTKGCFAVQYHEMSFVLKLYNLLCYFLCITPNRSVSMKRSLSLLVKTSVYLLTVEHFITEFNTFNSTLIPWMCHKATVIQP